MGGNGGRGTNVNNTYDSVGRLIEREINAKNGKFNTKYNYLMGEGGATSNKLKSITNNGKTITYDNIGNSLTYDGYAFTWEQER